jgi:aryl-alcohol dehydrogenase-like predicted oxidoreductase
MARYKDSQVEKAVAAYSSIASSHGLTPTQLSLSWCYHRPHVTSSIIGATTLEQLEENLKAFDVRLTEEVRAGELERGGSLNTHANLPHDDSPCLAKTL